MTHQDPSDADLMARLAKGDVSPIGDLAHRHQGRVLELAFRTLGHWDLAEDVAQETFLRVYRAAKTYQPQARFTTWLYRIVVNLCLDEQRRRARTALPLEAVAPEGLPASQANPAEKKEFAELVRAAVQELPNRQRLALVLHRYDGLSHTEISEITGWSESAVESLLVRAYANLREKLAKLKNLVE
ncbi:MAG TPA: sigma-70 family RNA polymerase sigma factor [Sedimentisphaerales bacterium]|nr:sigma-70 family RNA polymerase sigma factor [Sedimentisphaerales bacterium]